MASFLDSDERKWRSDLPDTLSVRDFCAIFTTEVLNLRRIQIFEAMILHYIRIYCL
ncbi:unnamed protein product [Cylicocyclus nassatus]|uniref:Uncharacterized protein n=1 Tax=Cylicocyclus nassatus TaxID=53992 RepID=A0AA36GZG6_CYLNA|nr:unnamed protein product [Cylicocyclus nassatus]